MPKPCERYINNSFLNLPPIMRLEHLLNLKQTKLKSIHIKLDKKVENDTTIIFSCDHPFFSLEQLSATAYITSKYETIEVITKSINNKNIIQLKCTKSSTWTTQTEVFELSAYEPSEDITVKMELYYLQ
jgi:hypothetical protein